MLGTVLAPNVTYAHIRVDPQGATYPRGWDENKEVVVSLTVLSGHIDVFVHYKSEPSETDNIGSAIGPGSHLLRVKYKDLFEMSHDYVMFLFVALRASVGSRYILSVSSAQWRNDSLPGAHSEWRMLTFVFDCLCHNISFCFSQAILQLFVAIPCWDTQYRLLSVHIQSFNRQ